MWKLRVTSHDTPAGWVWDYELHDLTLPTGAQVVVSGMRTTWGQAVTDGLPSLADRAGR